MSLYITSLNSGSNGNCYYIGNEHDAILVDAGLTCRETEKRMARLGLNMKSVRAIFISHEHGDHIKGVAVIAAKYNLPVYITKHTYNMSRMGLSADLVRYITVGCITNVNDFSVTAFSKIHDAIEPQSFTVSFNGVTIGVFTDLGRVCDDVVLHFRQCHAAFLEANYDAEMLNEGRYPIHLKNRIRGGKGHISNVEALALFKEHAPAHMSHLLLSHLSHDNNNPELVKNMFTAAAGKVNIVVASRYAETELYHITPTTAHKPVYLTEHYTRQATLF
ncbi:MAG: MBL fold metallo-hydrolase [Sphingobacteriales bacterium]|nr:MAG: MBL fold metallo-hydrolase [Sphingobacteriales bacterium]